MTNPDEKTVEIEGVVTFTHRDYQNVANDLMNLQLTQMEMNHTRLGEIFGDGGEDAGDAAPIVQGAIGGVIAFLIGGGVPDEKIRSIFSGTVDELLPQIRQAHLLGNTQGVA